MDKQELIDRLNGNYPEYTQKPQHKKVQREGQLQIACVRWFRLQYPAFSTLLFHPKNEADGATSGKRIAINAASGVVPGVPDLILALPSMKDGKTGIISENQEVYFGLGIELKFGKTNNQSANQKRFQEYWQCAGYKYALCRSLEAFMQVVNTYMKAAEVNAFEKVRSYHNINDDTAHNKKVLNKIINKKKRRDDHEHGCKRRY